MSLPPRGREIPKEIQPTEEGATVGPDYLTIGASGGPGLLDHCQGHLSDGGNVAFPGSEHVVVTPASGTFPRAPFSAPGLLRDCDLRHGPAVGRPDPLVA